MGTGLEDSSIEVLRALVNNLKSGTLLAIEKNDSAAFELDMTLLSIFEREFENRNEDFDGFVGEEIRTIMDNWVVERQEH